MPNIKLNFDAFDAYLAALIAPLDPAAAEVMAEVGEAAKADIADSVIDTVHDLKSDIGHAKSIVRKVATPISKFATMGEDPTFSTSRHGRRRRRQETRGPIFSKPHVRRLTPIPPAKGAVELDLEVIIKPVRGNE
jgi:hypothetical protein